MWGYIFTLLRGALPGLLTAYAVEAAVHEATQEWLTEYQTDLADDDKAEEVISSDVTKKLFVTVYRYAFPPFRQVVKTQATQFGVPQVVVDALLNMVEDVAKQQLDLDSAEIVNTSVRDVELRLYRVLRRTFGSHSRTKEILNAIVYFSNRPEFFDEVKREIDRINVGDFY